MERRNLAGISLALVLASCGASHHAVPRAERPTIVRPAHAVWCPGTGPAGSRRPQRVGFDARLLLGQTEGAASSTAGREGCRLRVAERDGHNYILTADFVANRIDVAITRGLITSVEIG